MLRPGLPRPAALVAASLLATALLAPTSSAQLLAGPPSISIDSPDAGATVRGVVNVTGNASDSGFSGDVEKVEIRIDNGTWREANGTEPWNYTWDTTLWASGSHRITARVTDDDGNNETDAVNVTINQAPELTIQRPRANVTVAGNVSVTGTAEDPEEALERVEIQVDDGPWRNATGTSNWAATWNTTGMADGNHTVTVRAFDGAKRPAAQDSVNVTVSNEQENPPSVEIVEPAPGASLAGFVEIRGVAHDAEGMLQSVDVRIDGGDWQPADGHEDWSLGWDTTTAEDGEHTITARADDGNSTTLSTVDVTVDNSGGLTIASPEPNAVVDGNVTLEGTMQAENASVESVQVQIDGGPWRDANGTEDWTFTWDTTTVRDGPHHVTVQALGEQGVVATTTLTVRVANGQGALAATAAGDSAAPELRLETTPEDESAEGSFTLAGMVEDADDETVRVEYRIDGGSWQPITVTAGEPFDREIDVSDLEPGEHTVTVRAADDEQSSAERTFTLHVEDEAAIPGPGAAIVVTSLVASLLVARRRARE